MIFTLHGCHCTLKILSYTYACEKINVSPYSKENQIFYGAETNSSSLWMREIVIIQQQVPFLLFVRGTCYANLQILIVEKLFNACPSNRIKGTASAVRNVGHV